MVAPRSGAQTDRFGHPEYTNRFGQAAHRRTTALTQGLPAPAEPGVGKSARHVAKRRRRVGLCNGTDGCSRRPVSLRRGCWVGTPRRRCCDRRPDSAVGERQVTATIIHIGHCVCCRKMRALDGGPACHWCRAVHGRRFVEVAHRFRTDPDFNFSSTPDLPRRTPGLPPPTPRGVAAWRAPSRRIE